MLITNGTCVSTIMTSRAGRSGSRRRHDSLNRGGLSLRCCEASTAPAAVFIATGGFHSRETRCWTVASHQCTWEAIDWQFFKAASTDVLPAITAENCCVHWLPTSWNCGIPTYWTPGSPGRFVVPGLVIGAAAIAFSVSSANAEAAFLYCGIW